MELGHDGFGCRWPVTHRRMVPDGVVMDTPALDHDLRLLEQVEDLTVEQLVAQLAVERFAVAALPWLSGSM